ncbi:MAG: thioredoxin domain-containing protein, partial [Thaumarchaeota archaeon]|nr:thioredoxin domain-containing protein [Nitrososphaerota archaeon]
RYSTDAKWLVPHFEKMLYDNALLPIVYAEAYQLTKDSFYLDVIQKTLDFVLREMTSPEGGFYCALDADSEGQEGKFYVWKKKEIAEILGKNADVFCLYYDVTDGGNFEGETILNNSIAASAVAFHSGMTEPQVKSIISESCKKLLEVRSKRVRPGLDDKSLTSWNALMISAFAKGYRVTDHTPYLNAAENCVSFIEKNLMPNGSLLRTYKNSKAKLPAYLEDYSYLINALVDLFEVKPEPKYLSLAVNLANHLIDHFWDEKNSSFYFTADNHESLIIRPKNNYDLSMPSGNSVAANALLKLYHLTQEKKFLEISTKFGFGYLLNAIYLFLQSPTEITLLNMQGKEIYDYLTKQFLPESVLVTIQNDSQLQSLARYSFFAGKEFGNDTTVFVCKNFSCSLPLKTIPEIEKLLF